MKYNFKQNHVKPNRFHTNMQKLNSLKILNEKKIKTFFFLIFFLDFFFSFFFFMPPSDVRPRRPLHHCVDEYSRDRRKYPQDAL
jgi:hypothetical protein